MRALVSSLLSVSPPRLDKVEGLEITAHDAPGCVSTVFKCLKGSDLEGVGTCLLGVLGSEMKTGWGAGEGRKRSSHRKAAVSLGEELSST